MIRVAIATENNAVDGEIFLRFLRLLGHECERWDTAAVPFSGWKWVHRHYPRFLTLAAGDGIQHAVVTIDNDGNEVKRPVHVETHDMELQSLNDQRGCATCLLRSAIPDGWDQCAAHLAITVPVQAMETWLHSLQDRGWPEPEQKFNRADLKKLFWGELRTGTSAATKIAHAESLLAAPGALDRLRERESFRVFEAQLIRW